jgi:hypothetical protein
MASVTRLAPVRTEVAIAGAASELPIPVQLPLCPATADLCPVRGLALKRVGLACALRAALMIQRAFVLSARASCIQSAPLLQLHR